MPTFEFDMALSATKTRAIYEGQARYILVESDQGVKLQLPASNFYRHVTAAGIQGRFSIDVDTDNRIVALRRL